ncbi:Porphobilinogen deaminase [Thalassoglobus neptunius]|uniref:Porphobilinogen deaminase n=1 Tax=Thalassoglobus neptunius TaxID=1938619 RepID=A0A5C5X993_9PLAN|nr:hydroxymethylbilane synthase [Thalassoglobus neptunius]TWT58442.1 Porphobilinogen deaminase [Thalassoglobus neptunius]
MNSSTSGRTIRIATRQSQLALWQANHIADLLRQETDQFKVELVPLSTIGDRDRSEPLRNMGGQGVFTREVQRAVLDQSADIAVHSLKDLPTDTVDGLALAGVPERAPRFDALLMPHGAEVTGLDELPEKARVGTGSPRRQAQILAQYPTLELCEIRGNVETRIRKLDEGEFDAVILAEAGLRRLGLEDRIGAILRPPVMYPAVGQAALGLECRDDDEQVIELLQSVTDDKALAEVTCERACLATLRAGCHAPVGIHCVVENDQIEATAVVLSPDGRERFEAAITGTSDDALSLGQQLAETLIAGGAEKVL